MSDKAQAAYHGRDIVDRLRANAPYTEDGPALREAAEEIEKLRSGFAELTALAKDWNGQSERAEAYSKNTKFEMNRRKQSIQRAMLLDDHAAAVERCIHKTKP